MRYAVTFGQKYNREETVHPAHPAITGSAYVVIEVPDEIIETFGSVEQTGMSLAYLKAMRLLNENFAFLYELDDDFQKQINDYNLYEVKLDG